MMIHQWYRTKTSRSITKIAVHGLLLPLLACSLLAGCGADRSTPAKSDSPLAPRKVRLDTRDVPEYPGPGGFVETIDNPYLGFAPRRVFRYEGEAKKHGHETHVLEVTTQTKMIIGVRTTVVHDQAFLDGELIEDTLDWFAQDLDGNVWYFGEDSKEIENEEVVSTEGSWEAGVDGALPGIIMLANPEVGIDYQQEFAEGVAEDRAKISRISETVILDYGTFTGCLRTTEWTPLEPGAREYKYYAPGVGLVLVEQRRGGGERVELVAIQN